MAGRRYTQYRGRQGGSAFLKGLVIVLAVLLALSVVAVLALGRYLRYTDEGTKLEVPWLQERPVPSKSPDLSGLIVNGDPQPEQSQEPDQSPAPSQPPAPLRALEVSPADVTGGRAAGLAAQAGADALVVAVKDVEGNLAWSSGQSLAKDDMNGDPAFNQAVAQLALSGGLHLAARVDTFQDLWTSVYVRELAILSKTGKLWYDHPGYSWLSLSDEAARSYITSLCLELAGMGFHEIVLEHAGYPDQGRTYNIAVGDKYPDQGKDLQAAAFLSQLSQRLEEKGVALSVQPEETVPDDGTVSGLTPAALAGIGGRVWLPRKADPAVWAQALAAAGMADAQERLVAWEPLEEGISWSGSRLLAGS